jgi:hypothetical protein
MRLCYRVLFINHWIIHLTQEFLNNLIICLAGKTLHVFMHTSLHRCYELNTYMRTYSIIAKYFSVYECSAFIIVHHFPFRSAIHSRVQNKGQYNVCASNEIFSIVHIQWVSHNVYTHTHTHTHRIIYICNSFIIRSLVFSLRGRAGRNQSPIMWPVWLWHTASWAISWG